MVIVDETYPSTLEEARRPAILARRLDDGELRALGLHVAIALARLPEPVGPPDLEPHQVVGVVDDPHGVGVR